MGVLQKRGKLAEDFYTEFVLLKSDIEQLIDSRDYFNRNNKENEVNRLQETINQKVERVKFILNELENVYGVSKENIIFLSMGVDV